MMVAYVTEMLALQLQVDLTSTLGTFSWRLQAQKPCLKLRKVHLEVTPFKEGGHLCPL